MERTISMMVGKGSISHNNRTFIAKNVDEERTRNNEIYVRESLKKVYHELFDRALEEYNTKQSRADRKIHNYYEKIRQSKQEKLFHELIVQIGNKDDTNCQTIDGLYAQFALMDYIKGFQKRNSNLRVFNAVLHVDETTPHLHIDFVPYSTGNKRGLETKVSLKGALKAQGFVGTGRRDTEWSRWVESEKQCLAEIMEKYHLEWMQKGTHEKHLSVYDYEKKMRKAEVEELEQRGAYAKQNYEKFHLLKEIEKLEYSKLSKQKVELSENVSVLQEQVSDIQMNKGKTEDELVAAQVKLDIVNLQIENAANEFEEVQQQTRVHVEQAKQLYEKYSRVAVTDRQYKMFGDMIQLKQENEQLKTENQTLQEKLQKAYNFMKQFTIHGMNMLDRFLESVGEKVRKFGENIGSRR